MTADNVSSSIEPVYEYVTSRPVNTPDGVAIMTVEDYGAAVLKIAGKRTAEVTAREHVDVLVAAQEFVDSAVSKTCNVTGDMPWDDFKRIYVDAWERGAKGCTTFNKDGKRAGLLSSGEESAVCEIDPSTGRRECA
jgi:ribonucleoside-diphosphate reductase alpha chain